MLLEYKMYKMLVRLYVLSYVWYFNLLFQPQWDLIIIFDIEVVDLRCVGLKTDTLLSYIHCWEYQDCILITQPCKPFLTIAVRLIISVWSVLLCLIFVTASISSFQKQESSVHFPLQIDKFVIVWFTLVFPSLTL